MYYIQVLSPRYMDLKLKALYRQYPMVRELYNSGQHVQTVVHCNQLEDKLDALELYKMQDIARQDLCRKLRKAMLSKLEMIRQRSQTQLRALDQLKYKKEYK